MRLPLVADYRIMFRSNIYAYVVVVFLHLFLFVIFTEHMFHGTDKNIIYMKHIPVLLDFGGAITYYYDET